MPLFSVEIEEHDAEDELVWSVKLELEAPDVDALVGKIESRLISERYFVSHPVEAEIPVVTPSRLLGSPVAYRYCWIDRNLSIFEASMREMAG